MVAGYGFFFGFDTRVFVVRFACQWDGERVLSESVLVMLLMRRAGLFNDQICSNDTRRVADFADSNET